MSEDDVVMKIVIDYDKYLKYKNLEKRLEDCEAKLKKELSLKSENLQRNETKNDEEPNEEKEVDQNVADQIGKGDLKLQEINNDTLKTISDYIYRQIKSDFNISPKSEASPSSKVEQIGLGDLLQESPVESFMDTTPEPSLPLVVHKNQQHDQFDHQSYIEKLPKQHQKRATELLIVFDNNPSDITFDEQGIVYIDQKSLPNSDFFKLLPEFFKVKPNTKLPGFDELITKVASLGYGHLLNRSLTRGLNRKKDIAHSEYLKIKDMHNWWYLGV